MIPDGDGIEAEGIQDSSPSLIAIGIQRATPVPREQPSGRRRDHGFSMQWSGRSRLSNERQWSRLRRPHHDASI